MVEFPIRITDYVLRNSRLVNSGSAPHHRHRETSLREKHLTHDPGAAPGLRRRTGKGTHHPILADADDNAA